MNTFLEQNCGRTPNYVFPNYGVEEKPVFYSPSFFFLRLHTKFINKRLIIKGFLNFETMNYQKKNPSFLQNNSNYYLSYYTYFQDSFLQFIIQISIVNFYKKFVDSCIHNKLMNKAAAVLILLSTILSSCNRPLEISSSNDNIPPATPMDVAIYAAYDGEIGIEWQSNSEPDLKGYNVYRKTDSTNYKVIDFTNDNYFIDDSLDYNTTYYYKISAVDNSNLESPLSNEVSAKPVNKYKPYAIQNININARNWEDTVSIYLNWVPSGETDIEGYNIYKSMVPAFSPDSASLIEFTKNDFYSDTSNLSFYTNYYYKIKAVDKGGLVSDESPEVIDEIYEIPKIIFPKNNTSIFPFSDFLIEALKVPATYQIIVQTNEFFGEIWSNTISTGVTNDTLNIGFNPNYIYPNKFYYWRVITFSNDNSEPNSVSRLYKFMIKQ